MWDKFDYIACICFTGYRDRQRSIEVELQRVGLSGKVHFFWDFPSCFSSILSKQVTHDSYHQKMFPIGYNNYRAIKTAYELGHSSILVLEDDVRFLKNIEHLGEAISSIPDEFELVMLDKNFPSDEFKKFIQEHPSPLRVANKIEWRNFVSFHSSGCYALSRAGMMKFIVAYEASASNKRVLNNDEYFNSRVFDKEKIFAAFPNVAVQCLVGSAGCHSPLEGYWHTIEYQGGAQSMYNLECPYVSEQNFHQLLYRAADREIQFDGVKSLKSENAIFLSIPLAPAATVVKSTSFRASFSDKMAGIKYGGAIIWGNGAHLGNRNSLQVAYRDKCPVILCEDGFIRSYTTWVDKSVSDSLNAAHSVIFDTSAYYFDAIRISTVEKWLNDPSFIVTAEQKYEARRLIDKIVSSKVSKYNHQPIFTPQIGRLGVRKVLVIDQSYGDFSINRGMANDETFERMLTSAIMDNPDADILVKTHPDTLAGKKEKKKGYYQDVKAHDNIYKVTIPINPYSLMEICDKVYVCSSQFGMEALMAGKEVHVFGMPFYAGWGLTIDYQHLDRRTNRRTLEELFYIFYCLYTHWVNPEKGCETTIDAVIDKMIKLRIDYTNKPSHPTYNSINHRKRLA